MAHITPYWYKLILFWVKQKNRTGLTIPFIIGSRKFAMSGASFLSVEELLNDIVNTDIDDVLTLFHCPDVGEYVIGINHPTFPMRGLELRNKDSNKTRLVAALSTEILGKNIEDISDSLSKKYQDCLIKEFYSLDSLKWVPYSEKDISLIMEALNS